MLRSVLTGTLAAGLMAMALMAANFGLAPARLDFGSVPRGGNKSMTFKISPQSAMDFQVASDDDAFAVVGDHSFRAGRETAITVRFSPGSAGPHGGKITISAPGDGISKTVTVSGVGE